MLLDFSDQMGTGMSNVARRRSPSPFFAALTTWIGRSIQKGILPGNIIFIIQVHSFRSLMQPQATTCLFANVF
jgi:hypothetical protein